MICYTQLFDQLRKFLSLKRTQTHNNLVTQTNTLVTMQPGLARTQIAEQKLRTVKYVLRAASHVHTSINDYTQFCVARFGWREVQFWG